MPDLYLDVDAALAEVPVNIFPLIDDTDFKTREVAVAYNAAGMDLVWNFVTPAGAYTQTAVTPTTSGDYDWAHQGDGMYSIEIPASGGASINNDTEGFGWFTGIATGVLPWRGPIICFRAAGLNDKLIESAYSATRGLSGTALPDAAAEAAGGLYTRGTGAGQINQPANGQIDANTVKVAGTAQTAGDVVALINAVDDFVDTEVAAIKAKTDNLPSDPADASDIASAFSTVNTTLATIAGYLDTEIAAIKAKTDNLPSDPADNSDILAAIDALPTGAENADALLGRNIAGGSSTGRTVKQALRLLRNLREIVAGVLTVYEEDDTTPSWTANVGQSAGDPVNSIDPD